jgi:hypothetical protein
MKISPSSASRAFNVRRSSPHISREFARIGHSASNQRPAAGNHIDFSGELPGPVLHNQPFALQVRLNDFHAARKQHKEWDIAIARFKQNVPRFDRSQPCQWPNSIDLSSR